MNKINKILVANRGEIALRIMKTLRRMGILSVAVYSEADKNSPHVMYADQALCIGPPPSSESYLNSKKIIQAALNLKADAIHPGYGFLSENADFARQVQKAGLIFIGPDPEAIEIMGDKLASREAVKKYAIPLVPGTSHPVKKVGEASTIAGQLGYPVLIKASAGGGGKGMRVVHSSDEMKEQMQRAISEATAAFGNGSVYIEKYIPRPRHIEIQILADNEGNTVYLFERECSIQRRNQKVIEEAPSVIADTDMRKKMGDSAVLVAKACRYKGAGTVEFLAEENKNFYFLEMNTRLQVEHPVTEMITGIDLVEQQIRIARGENLPFIQEEIKIKGHAVELRIYAENVRENFSPSTGTITTYKKPQGKNIRVDDGIALGSTVSVYYDPMLAKLIAYGNDRTEAIQTLLQAIEEYDIRGVETTLPFGYFVCSHPAFVSGNFNTGFVEQYYTSQTVQQILEKEGTLAAGLSLALHLKKAKKLRLP